MAWGCGQGIIYVMEREAPLNSTHLRYPPYVPLLYNCLQKTKSPVHLRASKSHHLLSCYHATIPIVHNAKKSILCPLQHTNQYPPSSQQRTHNDQHCPSRTIVTTYQKNKDQQPVATTPNITHNSLARLPSLSKWLLFSSAPVLPFLYVSITSRSYTINYNTSIA